MPHRYSRHSYKPGLPTQVIIRLLTVLPNFDKRRARRMCNKWRHSLASKMDTLRKLMFPLSESQILTRHELLSTYQNFYVNSNEDSSTSASFSSISSPRQPSKSEGGSPVHLSSLNYSHASSGHRHNSEASSSSAGKSAARNSYWKNDSEYSRARVHKSESSPITSPRLRSDLRGNSTKTSEFYRTRSSDSQSYSSPFSASHDRPRWSLKRQTVSSPDISEVRMKPSESPSDVLVLGKNTPPKEVTKHRERNLSGEISQKTTYFHSSQPPTHNDEVHGVPKKQEELQNPNHAYQSSRYHTSDSHRVTRPRKPSPEDIPESPSVDESEYNYPGPSSHIRRETRSRRPMSATRPYQYPESMRHGYSGHSGNHPHISNRAHAVIRRHSRERSTRTSHRSGHHDHESRHPHNYKAHHLHFHAKTPSLKQSDIDNMLKIQDQIDEGKNKERRSVKIHRIKTSKKSKPGEASRKVIVTRRRTSSRKRRRK